MLTICDDADNRTGYLSEPENRPQKRRSREHTLYVSNGLAHDCVDALKHKARLAVVVGKLWTLKILTQELFDLRNVEFEVDPDEPDQHFLIFNVAASGDIKEIAARRREWHRKIDGFLERDRGYVRLIIDVI